MPTSPSRSSSARGFTLIELLIAISLMIVITLILTQIFNSTVDIFSRAQQQVQIYSNEKAFVELLTRELNNFLPPSTTGIVENAMRIYSPKDLNAFGATTAFPDQGMCPYQNSYYEWDENYTDLASPDDLPYPDEIDLSGGKMGYGPAGDSTEEWSPPLLAFATTTTYVTNGERVIAPAWVEYFMAKARVYTEGSWRTYYYLKRRLMRLEAVMPGDVTYYDLGLTEVGSGPLQLPYIERPKREELFRTESPGGASVGSFDGEVVLEFFPALDSSSEFADATDAFRIEFYVYDALADDGKGGFAWIRPDQQFGEAVFMPSMENPLNDQATADPQRPSRGFSSDAYRPNFYPEALKSQPAPGGGAVIYAMDTPLAIRITALLAHDRTASFPESGSRRQDYSTDDVPPRVFQHVFWLPSAPASLVRF